VEKNFIAIIESESVALVDSEKIENIEPNKTIYDLKVINLKKGEIVLVVQKKENENSSLIIKNGQLFWIISGELRRIS